MATLKEVNLKIKGVKKTKQITNAMKMVATSRLKGAQNRMEAFEPYAQKYAQVLGSLVEKMGENANPLLVERDEIKKVNIVLCTSDKGLCGGFNVNLIHTVEKFLKEYPDQEISFTNFGKRGNDWTRKEKKTIRASHLDVVGAKNIEFSFASNEGNSLIEDFLNGQLDKVFIVYSEFKSMARQVPVIKQLLPIPPAALEEEKEEADKEFMAEHICEPTVEKLMEILLPKSVHIQIFNALLQTSTSEKAARMTAMDNATKACNDIISELQTIYNKTRQAAITSELIDIVGGASAV